MTKNQKMKSIRYRQKVLNQSFTYFFVTNLIIIFAILIIALMVQASEKNKIEDEIRETVCESVVDHGAVNSSANTSPDMLKPLDEENVYCRNLSEDEKFLLAKLAMAEAEGESLKTKTYIIFTVLNRVESDEAYFPDTIEEVIHQRNSKGTYQFSPVGSSKWDKLLPNEECWKAVEIVNNTERDLSGGALYFEACKGESWHSRNLELICQSDSTRFYK